jgi:hypothetical protein
MRVATVVGVFLGCVLPVAAAPVDKYLPDDTEALVALNIRQLLDSPVVKKHALAKIKEYIKSNEDAEKI